MAITVLQVLTTALEQAQLDNSSSFLALARKYYNLVIRNLSRNTDWPVYNVSTSTVNFIAGQLSYNLPADYQRASTIYLVNTANNNASSNMILIVDKFKFDQLKSPSLSGVPNIAWIDQDLGKVTFDSVPSQNYGYILNYYRKGTEIALDGSNDSAAPDFPDEMALIKDLTAWFMNYTDDQRAPMAEQKAKAQYGDFKQNVYDNSDDSIVQLAPSRQKPGRRRGSGGWSSS